MEKRNLKVGLCLTIKKRTIGNSEMRENDEKNKMKTNLRGTIN